MQQASNSSVIGPGFKLNEFIESHFVALSCGHGMHTNAMSTTLVIVETDKIRLLEALLKTWIERNFFVLSVKL